MIYSRKDIIEALINCVIESDWNCCGTKKDIEIWSYVEANESNVRELLNKMENND